MANRNELNPAEEDDLGINATSTEGNAGDNDFEDYTVQLDM